MRYSVPHPIPYQGSKRRLANAILSHMPRLKTSRLVEPFAGSAAVTLAAASQRRFEHFLIADRLQPLADLWQEIITDPSNLAADYKALWLREREKPIEAYYNIRAEFNTMRDSARLLYLLARCVKNAVRFNPAGEFNQSPDKRRTGTLPRTMQAELFAAHHLLANRSQSMCADFMDLFHAAQPGDLFYLDPPYQGTSEGRDARYIAGVSKARIIEGLTILNQKGIPFILSYDGTCGDRTYGDRLPLELASRVLLDVGRSSQATLNGHNHTTVESLYISHRLMPAKHDDTCMTLSDFDQQQAMAFA